MTFVFDASALLAYLKGERGGPVTEALLRDRTAVRLVHAINLCEVYYHYLKLGNAQLADSVIRDLEQTGLMTRDEIDPPFWRRVAAIKADVLRVSLGDCFGIALAQQRGGAVVTADHAEFDVVDVRGICSVRFIR